MRARDAETGQLRVRLNPEDPPDAWVRISPESLRPLAAWVRGAAHREAIAAGDIPVVFSTLGARPLDAALACNATSSSAGHASVEVSTNGREYTVSGVRFELVSLVVGGVAPWSGPALGGTVVTIGGSRLVLLRRVFRLEMLCIAVEVLSSTMAMVGCTWAKPFSPIAIFSTTARSASKIIRRGP